jgi:anti-sigma regulatory factor (Ser/Thr protein kinase)
MRACLALRCRLGVHAHRPPEQVAAFLRDQLTARFRIIRGSEYAVTAPDTCRPQLTSGLTLAAVPTAARVARSFVRQRLSQWGLNQLISDAELVLSELVANAVNATGTTNPNPHWSELHNLALITVRLFIAQDSLIVEVWDRDARPPEQKLPEQGDETGRGLLIVDALCRRWNYFYPDSGGKAVWGELVIPAHGG